ncbi:MAG TPA: GH32 C-terminal domain-containing protein, partial [Verrucomicrobiae bacterium]
FTDYSNNPVAVHSGQGRDPHLFWFAPAHCWVMAVYDDAGGNGVQFYSTPDFHTWTYGSKLYNGFFECPDMFQLPVDGNPSNLMWVLNDASGGYQLGQFDGTNFTPGTTKLPGNNGNGFYASQTFTGMAPGDDRKVRIGWAILGMPGMPFNQAMFFPTALSLNTTSNGVRLCSLPVAEWTNNILNTYVWTNLTLNTGVNPLAGLRGANFELQAVFNPGPVGTLNCVLNGVAITYDAAARQITVNGNTQSLPPINGTVTLELLGDRQMLEIFGNGGQLYMPLAGMPYDPANKLVSLTSSGASFSFKSLRVCPLRSAWTQPVKP